MPLIRNPKLIAYLGTSTQLNSKTTWDSEAQMF